MPDVELTVNSGVAVDVTVSEGPSVSVAKTEVVRAKLKEDIVHGREHTTTMQRWTGALAGTAPRVVVSGDSMMELTSGFALAWNAIQEQRYGAAPSQWWWPPTWVGTAFFSWPVQEGTATAIGPDRRGTTLDVGEDAGTTGSAVTCDRIAIYYTAHTSGCDLEIRIDGTLVDTIDTSEDEDGNAVAADTPSQRWVSDSLGFSGHTFLLTAAGTGTARVEAAQFLPESGMEVAGFGTSGISTASIVSNGNLVDFVEAMVARDEPPDLIIIGADTADSGTSAELVASNTTLVGQLRTAAPGVTIAYWIGTGHNARTDWENDKVPAFLNMCLDLDLVPLNAFASMGDISNGEDPNTYSGDGVHFNAKGQEANARTVLDALFSRFVPATPAALQSELDDHLADTTDAHDASAISYQGGTGIAADDVEEALDELATEKANKAGNTDLTGTHIFTDSINGVQARIQDDGSAGMRIALRSVGDAHNRFQIGLLFGSTIMAWGDGSAAPTAIALVNSGSTLALTGSLSVSGTVTCDDVPTDNAHLTNKLYVDGLIDVDVLAPATTAVGNVGTGTDTLQSTTIAAGKLAADGDYLTFRAWGTIANNANTGKRVIVAWGTTGATQPFNSSSGGIPANVSGDWHLEGTIIRTGATSQKSSVRFSFASSGTAYSGPPCNGEAALARTLSQAQDLIIAGIGTSDNDVVCDGLEVEYHTA